MNNEDSLAILGGSMKSSMSKESSFPTKEENNNGKAIQWTEIKINDAAYELAGKDKIGSGAIKNIV